MRHICASGYSGFLIFTFLAGSAAYLHLGQCPIFGPSLFAFTFKSLFPNNIHFTCLFLSNPIDGVGEGAWDRFHVIIVPFALVF